MIGIFQDLMRIAREQKRVFAHVTDGSNICWLMGGKIEWCVVSNYQKFRILNLKF